MSGNDFRGFGGQTEYVGFGSLAKAESDKPADATTLTLQAHKAGKAAHAASKDDKVSSHDKMQHHLNASACHATAASTHGALAEKAHQAGDKKGAAYHNNAAQIHRQSDQYHQSRAVNHSMQAEDAHKSLRSDDMDFNDFFKSEDKCSECGHDLEKSGDNTVAKQNKHGKKHAGPKGSGFVDHHRGHGGNEHKKNKTEKSESQELTFQKAFPVTDSFRAVEYVAEDGQVFSSMDQLQLK
jgi:hypothetical protein